LGEGIPGPFDFHYYRFVLYLGSCIMSRKEEMREWGRLYKELVEPRQLKGQLVCVRCREYDWLTHNGLCGRCVETLRSNYPDTYEEARQENIKLYDEGKQLHYSEGEVRCL
jgi:hypothetical protein